MLGERGRRLRGTTWDFPTRLKVDGAAASGPVADLLSHLPSSNRLPMIITFERHLRFDRQGYPSVRADWTQHPVSRLACVADVFDAMTSRRAYKTAIPSQNVCAYIRHEAGRTFGPRLVRVLDLMLEQLRDEPRAGGAA